MLVQSFDKILYPQGLIDILGVDASFRLFFGYEGEALEAQKLQHILLVLNLSEYCAE